MIKNIIFDIDGVLVNLDKCYHAFITETYPEHKDLKFEEMTQHWPIEAYDGAFCLSKCYRDDFVNSSYYTYRPLFESTLEVLKTLKGRGLKLITLSAARSPKKKLPVLLELFGDLFDAYEFSSPHLAKDEGLSDLVQKYKLEKDETLFIDDRVYNIHSGLNVGLTVVHKRSRLSIPLPEELSHVPSIFDLKELIDLIK